MCFEVKETDEFNKDLSRKDGLRSRCTLCANAFQSDYRKRHAEKIKIDKAHYSKTHPDKIRAKTAKRRANKLQRTPSWLTKEQFKEIEEFYYLSHKLTKETGTPHHVDHLIPLQGRKVSGLHVPWNLQVITRTENCKKSNKF